MSDAKTLLIPDRRGNNRLDSLKNILFDNRIGMLFLIPGYGETLRVNAGIAAGARPLTGGSRWGDVGFYLEPTVFVDAEPEFSVVREEIFGPVTTVQSWGDEDEMMVRANDTSFGLAG
ncbi:MAG: aldehyde dehydrogenase family protein, partial [Mesorhizobium sp.]|nr:aldehyde dehydrogenase family protein [Mesorhizobium sp.]